MVTRVHSDYENLVKYTCMVQIHMNSMSHMHFSLYIKLKIFREKTNETVPNTLIGFISKLHLSKSVMQKVRNTNFIH